MTFVLKDRVRESSTTTGTGAFALAGAPGGYQRFSAVMSVADTCWYAIILPGSSWETGIGTYSALNTLTRTTVLESSNAGAAVSFGAGTKDVFICAPASKANVQNNTFPSGTLMLFQQTAAPTYWTKQVTHNNKALRVTSGTAGSGGSYTWTQAFGTSSFYTATGHTLTVSELASHGHNVTGGIYGGSTYYNNYGNFDGLSGPYTPSLVNISVEGGGSSHTHPIEALNVQYVDIIIASKD